MTDIEIQVVVLGHDEVEPVGTDHVAVDLHVIPDDIAYPIWAADTVLETRRDGQRARVELDSIRWIRESA